MDAIEMAKIIFGEEFMLENPSALLCFQHQRAVSHGRSYVWRAQDPTPNTINPSLARLGHWLEP